MRGERKNTAIWCYLRVARWVIVVGAVVAAGVGGCDFLTRRSFFGAVKLGDVKSAERGLTLNPRLIHAEDEWGESGLNIAVDMGDLPTVRMLLRHGAEVHHEGPLTGLPLHRAADSRNQAVTHELLKAGADPNRHKRRRSTNCFGTALHWAVGVGRLEPVAILLEHGADVNAPAIDHGGVTPLIFCVWNGETGAELVDVAQRLIEAGADVNAVDYDGATALDAVQRRIGRLREIHERRLRLNSKRKKRPEHPRAYKTAEENTAEAIAVLGKIERILMEHGAVPGNTLDHRDAARE